LATNSQEVAERFYNLLAVGESAIAGSCQASPERNSCSVLNAHFRRTVLRQQRHTSLHRFGEVDPMEPRSALPPEKVGMFAPPCSTPFPVFSNDDPEANTSASIAILAV